MRVLRKGETPLFALGTPSESWDTFGMGLETQVVFEHTDPREGRAWPEYQRQNLGVCVEDSAERPRGLGCAGKQNESQGGWGGAVGGS